MTVLEDEYGRRTKFSGTKLISESTDTSDREKPQWAEIEVWSTEGGAYVVTRATHYRTFHLASNCSKLGIAVPSQPKDIIPCKRCNRIGLVESGRYFGNMSRRNVDVIDTPGELIEHLKVEGTHTGFAKAILADLSEQDDRIKDLWMLRTVQ